MKKIWVTIALVIVVIVISGTVTFYFAKSEIQKQNAKLELRLNKEIISLKETVRMYEVKAEDLYETMEDLKDDYDRWEDYIEEFINGHEGLKGKEEDSEYYTLLSINKNNTISRGQTNAKALTWVIMHNGEIVLERNAENETQYKYFGTESGNYTVYLKAWIDSGYKTISNVVTYTIN